MADESEKTLRDRGMILLCGKVDDVNIKNTAMDLLSVDCKLEADYDHIDLIINSPGGACDYGFMLVDIIDLCRRPVHITGLGTCASMGFIILCSGEKGHRKITKNTALLCHQFSWSFKGKRHELVSQRREEELLHQRFISHLVKHTKLNKKDVEKILLPETDVWLSPEQAVEYGIVDEIIKN
jgi:ATP-dependent Clp protease protease subunit